MIWRKQPPAPYQRHGFPEFLDHCAAETAAFYRYWDGKRRGRPMPARADLDPAEIVRFLPGLLLVDVGHSPFRMTYRLVGTLEAQARGSDPTGKSVLANCVGADREAVIETYRIVIQEKRPLFDPELIPSADQRIEEAGSLFLPLSDDGQIVNMVVVYTHFRRH